MIRYFYEDKLEDVVKEMNEYCFEKTTVEQLKEHLDYMVKIGAETGIGYVKSMYIFKFWRFIGGGWPAGMFFCAVWRVTLFVH